MHDWMQHAISVDQYKLTNIVKWEEIDKMDEMNTVTLQN